jgi:hypothetical protein
MQIYIAIKETRKMTEMLYDKRKCGRAIQTYSAM